MALEFSNSTAEASTITVPARIQNGNQVAADLPPGTSAFRFLRYAWTNFPNCILYNEHNLPAGPFFLILDGAASAKAHNLNSVFKRVGHP